MVQPNSEEVLAYDLLSRKGEDTRIPWRQESGIRERVESEILLDRRVHHHRSGRQVPGPRRRRGHSVDIGDALRLPDPFVVPEDERSVLVDRPPSERAKLVPLEGWNRALVKKVSRIERAIAQELVHASMELVCARSRDGIDDSARGLPVLG